MSIEILTNLKKLCLKEKDLAWGHIPVLLIATLLEQGALIGMAQLRLELEEIALGITSLEG